MYIYTHNCMMILYVYIYTLYGLGTVSARHRFNTFLFCFDFSSDNFLLLGNLSCLEESLHILWQLQSVCPMICFSGFLHIHR